MKWNLHDMLAQENVNKSTAASLKVTIATIEAEILTTETRLYELQNKRAELVTQRAQLICPFVVGDRIKWEESLHWSAGARKFKEGIVTHIRVTYGDSYELSYKRILKTGKVSKTVRRLWNNRNIVERNGQPIEIKEAL